MDARKKQKSVFFVLAVVVGIPFRIKTVSQCHIGNHIVVFTILSTSLYVIDMSVVCVLYFFSYYKPTRARVALESFCYSFSLLARVKKIYTYIWGIFCFVIKTYK